MPTNERINVMHLGSPTGLYGAERWILALVRHLDQTKVHTTVAAIKDDPALDAPLCSEAAKLGFATHIFEAPGKMSFAAVRQIRRYILDNDIHIVHSHFYKTDLIGLLATRGTSCRMVTTPHGWSTQAGFKLRCYEQLDRMIFPFMDAVVPLSPDLYDAVISYFSYRIFRSFKLNSHPRLTTQRITTPRITYQRLTNNNSQITKNDPPTNRTKNLHLIPNSVDLTEIDAVRDSAPELSQWRAEGAFIIGYVGQLIHRKGLDILMQALQKLDSGVNWKAAVIGDGPQKNELQDLSAALNIEDRVRFFGYQGKRLEYMQGFDLFVLPSRLEGIPRCLMEAMAAGVPVVATDIPGCRDLIAHEGSGLLVAAGDSNALAQAIAFCANQPEAASRLAANARKEVRNKFSAERMAREYEELYALLC